MNISAKIKRRLVVGAVLGALAVSPFVIRNYRRTTQLPGNYISTFPVPRDSSVIPSGKIDVVNEFISFEPLQIPQGNLQSRTQCAVVSNDQKWLFVSYSFGEDFQTQICCSPLDNLGVPETFAELKRFGKNTVVLGMGASSLASRGNGRLSYCLREFEEGIDACNQSLASVSLLHDGKNLKISSDVVEFIRYATSTSYWNFVRPRNHCWLEGKDAFIFLYGTSLAVAHIEDVFNNGVLNLRYLQKENEQYNITSNLFQDAGMIKFLDAPIYVSGNDNRLDPTVDPYRTDQGQLVYVSLEGTTNDGQPFPVPSRNRTTLITKTHILFPSTGGQLFLTASLENPQEYYELRFQLDEIRLPGSGINYVFNPLLILPSGRHLLCARDVGRSFIDQARALGMPLSELGIIELPFKIG